MFFENVTKDNYDWWEAYTRSKLINVFFTRGLKAYLARENVNTVKCVCLHPGVVNSGFYNDSSRNNVAFRYLFCCLTPVLPIFLKNEEEGSQTNYHLCLTPWDKLKDGAYYADCKPKKTHPGARDEY